MEPPCGSTFFTLTTGIGQQVDSQRRLVGFSCFVLFCFILRDTKYFVHHVKQVLFNQFKDSLTSFRSRGNFLYDPRLFETKRYPSLQLNL